MKDLLHEYKLHYFKWHEPSEGHYLTHLGYLKKLAKYFPEGKDIKILDIGCGIGCILFCLRKLGYQNIEGIEIEKEFVEIARRQGLKIQLVEDSVNWLKEREKTYDVILLLDVLEHIEKNKQIEFLKAINNSLKSDGKLILTVPNANSPFASRFRYIDWTHTTSFTEYSIEYILKNSGFSKIEIKQIDPFSIYWLFKKISRLIYRIFLISEFGLRESLKIPLSLNLLVIAWK